MKSYLGNILFFIISFLLIPSISWAYLDPGTGSFIIQIIVASVVGTIVTLKIYWKKFINFFRGKKDSDEEDDEE